MKDREQLRIKSNVCPINHESMTATKYRDFLPQTMRVIDQEVPQLLNEASNMFLKKVEAGWDNRGDIHTYWDESLVPLFLSHIGSQLGGIEDVKIRTFKHWDVIIMLTNLDKEISGVSEGKEFTVGGIPPHEWVPEGWWPIIMELGIFTSIPDKLSDCFIAVNLCNTDDLRSKNVDWLKEELMGDVFEDGNFQRTHKKEYGDYKVICKGKAIAQTTIYGLTLNYILQRIGVDERISIVKTKNGHTRRKGLSEISNEFESIRSRFLSRQGGRLDSDAQISLQA